VRPFARRFLVVSIISLMGCGTHVADNPLHLPTAPNGRWQRIGTIMTGTSAEEYSVQEPTVIYDDAPTIFPDQSNVFKMWHTCGWSSGNVCYAESKDGVHFTRYNNGSPIISGVGRPFVLHIGATYYLYATREIDGLGWDRYESSDGISWTLTQSLALKVGGTAWENGLAAGNIFVWIEGKIWYTIYEARGSDHYWRVGLATSQDGISWVKYSGNPVISYPYCGGPEIHKVSGIYYFWGQCTQTGTVVTDIYRFHSRDLHAWTPDLIELSRATPDEGVGENNNGQVADPSMVEVNGTTFMYYDATRTQEPSAMNGGVHIKLAIAHMSLSSLVAAGAEVRASDPTTGSLPNP